MTNYPCKGDCANCPYNTCGNDKDDKDKKEQEDTDTDNKNSDDENKD